MVQWPKRYFTGLGPKMRLAREKELLRRRTLPYSKLRMDRTDKLAKPRKSKWTLAFHKEYPGLPFNRKLIAKKTGIKQSILNTVYNRGLKAWKTGGSRVGANPQQWGAARVYKFVLVTDKKYPTTRRDPNQDMRA